MAEPTAPKRVWIVGAGFSRPLGGPLLADLLSESARHQIELRYKDDGIELTQAPASRIVYWLYNLGKTTNGFDLEDWVQSDYPPKVNIHRTWDNAEDFLAWLDDAANSEGGYPADEYQWILDRATEQSNGRSFSRFPGHRVPEPPEIWWSEVTAKIAWQHAKRLLCAETSVFLKGEQLNTELWFPYTNWARNLTASDSIISFNYDDVIERAAVGANTETRSVGLVTPTSQEEANSSRGACPILLKLHGSSSWKLESGKIVVTEDNQWDGDILIAVPGRSKSDTAFTHLTFLWQLAVEVLRDAEQVYVIGYSFPKSDIFTKQMMVVSLPLNPNKPTVKVVLGNSNIDAERVGGLLRLAGQGRAKVRNMRLWTEEILSTLPLNNWE